MPDGRLGDVVVSPGDIAPELDVDGWVGTPTPLASVRGHVVLIEAFQMLCAGCIYHGLPQAQRVQRLFPDVVVVGLHTAFEHRAVTGRDALEVFVSELGISFPVAIDRHDSDTIPITMRRYALGGTPSTIVIDRSGRVRLSHLGTLDDLALGGVLGRLLAEATSHPGPAIQS